MADFNIIFETLKDGVISLAKETFANYAKQAKSDGIDILNQMKENLETWTAEYVSGTLTQNDLTTLLKGEKESLEVEALTEAGIAKANLDGFKDGIISLIQNTIFDLI